MEIWTENESFKEFLQQSVIRSVPNAELLALVKTQFPAFKGGLRTLQNYLKHFGFKRHSPSVTPAEVIEAVQKELKGSGVNLGYRSMWMTIRIKYGLLVKRQQVYDVMKYLCPEGFDVRKPRGKVVGERRHFVSVGVNFVWSMDGYDKLCGFRKSQYPFGIFGIIDVHSRKILSLKVGKSNNNPQVIAQYFLDTIKQHGVIPAVIRTDGGTEHTVVHQCQRFLRSEHSDAIAKQCVRTGPSTSNTVIERFWREVRHDVADHFRVEFKDLLAQGNYNPEVHWQRHLLLLVYEEVIQKELDSFADMWNSHHIRKQKEKDRPHGRPDVLFATEKQCGLPLDMVKLNFAVSQLAEVEFISTPIILYFRQSFNALPPLTVSNAKETYKTLAKKYTGE